MKVLEATWQHNSSPRRSVDLAWRRNGSFCKKAALQQSKICGIVSGSPRAAMTKLFTPGYSVTRTKRRRLLWAAWWSGPPAREPFRKPDAAQGGARTLDEARAQAEHAAQRPLTPLDPSWARAWARMLQGDPPWPSAEPQTKTVPRAAARSNPEVSVWAVLGLSSRANAEEVKSAYRRRALELHPDRGGDAAQFRALHAAYEEALRRLAKKPRRR